MTMSKESKTKIIKVKAHYSGSRDRNEELEIEVPEDATESEIEKIASEEVTEWAMQYCDIGYKIEP
jgi:hypothetical protein